MTGPPYKSFFVVHEYGHNEERVEPSRRKKIKNRCREETVKLAPEDDRSLVEATEDNDALVARTTNNI